MKKGRSVSGVDMNKLTVSEFAALATKTKAGEITGFPVGTRVRTEHGERSVETLKEGDRIITRHGKLVTVAAVELGDVPTSQGPILISKGALGGGLPRRDVMMAPDQNILLADPLLEQLFDCATAMVTTRDLIGLEGVDEMSNTTPLAYVQVQCDAPEVLFCSGLACVSHTEDEGFTKAPKLDKSQTETYLAQL